METQRQRILRAARGDQHAQRELLVESTPFLRAVLRQFGRHADDAFGDTCEAVLKGFKTFRLASERRVRRQFRCWLAAVARHSALRLLRRESRRETLALPDGVEPSSEHNSWHLEPIHQRARDAAFGIMPLRARLAWIGKEEQVPAAQIGQQLGCSVSGANYHKFVASSLFRGILQRHLDQ